METVLDFHHHPLRYRDYVDPAHPLPEGVERLLDLAVARSEAESLRQQAEQLQVTPEELLTAVRFFIRQVLLAQRADPYHTLGLTPSASPGQIRSHYRKLIRLFHPDREANHDEWHAAYAARINEAYAVLRDPDKRRAYDSRSSHPQRAGDPPKWRAIQDIHVLEAPQKRGEINTTWKVNNHVGSRSRSDQAGMSNSKTSSQDFPSVRYRLLSSNRERSTSRPIARHFWP
jgi:DnaJ-domain-containing protein 1